ncbi:hypothetical protein DL93DRAFT_2089492, partial [Clavulina sp. PMI_390]
MLKGILILEIPKLYPVGTDESYIPARPAAVISHPFLNQFDRIGWSNLVMLDKWKPPSLQSGTVVLHTRRPAGAGGDLLIILSLHGAAAPCYSVQVLQVSLPYEDSEYRQAALVADPGGGMLILDCLALLDAKEEPLGVRFFPFAEDGTLGEPIKRRQLLPFPYIGKMGLLCFVSGAAILQEEFPGDEPNTQLVGIVC